MSEDLPVSRSYNLGHLGQGGDEVRLDFSESERRDLARFAGVMGIEAFGASVALAKSSSDRFRLDFALDALVVQACVITLAELRSPVQLRFCRELHYAPLSKGNDPVQGVLEDDRPEEIASLHYDLALPVIEEFVLSIDPYPRAPGVEFLAPAQKDMRPQSPFAALNALKSGR
ncbi:MAG: hypothetical protein ACREFW_00260 [Rhizomicrobium sp.]